MKVDLEGHEILKCRLRLVGSSMAKIARSLGISQSSVTVVSQGYRRSHRVQREIAEALREAFLHAPERNVEIRADLRDMGWIAVKVGTTWHPAMANQSGFDGVNYDELQEATRTLRLKHRRDAELDAPMVRRAIERISEINRRAFALRELTPFHITDLDVERNQSALHFPLRSDAERLGHALPSSDPLSDGIHIVPRAGGPSENPTDHHEQSPPARERRNRWRFDDEQ